MQVVHTDLRRTGTFACSDDDLNRLHEIADWSFRGNAVDVPTDCPTRERLAWTGDYQIFAPTATRLYDVLGFSRKWLRSVRDDQLDDGRIANFSPDGRRIKHHLDDQFAMMTGSAGWGDAIVAVPWELYESYGDEQVLAENWDAMVRWVEWALEKARTERHHAASQQTPEPEPFEEYLWDGTFHWGEWTEPKERAADGTLIDPIKTNPMAWFMADKGEVGTAYLYRSTATLVAGRTRPRPRRRGGPLRAHRRAGPRRLAGRLPARRRHHRRRHPGELRARAVVRTGARRAAGCRGRTSRRAHPLRRHAPAHRLPLHRRPAARARRHRPRRRRVRAAVPAHRAVVAEHDRPRCDHDLGGLGGHRRVRRRARVAQPLQQGRGDPLPAHPHPRAAPGAGLGGVGIRRHRAGPRALAHLGARLPRDPAGNHPRRVAHRGRRASHLRASFRRRHPLASCSPTAPSPRAGPGSFHGQRSLPQPSSALAPAN